MQAGGFELGALHAQPVDQHTHHQGGFLLLGVMVFVLLYNPLKSSLCPFVLKHRARAPPVAARHCGCGRWCFLVEYRP